MATGALLALVRLGKSQCDGASPKGRPPTPTGFLDCWHWSRCCSPGCKRIGRTALVRDVESGIKVCPPFPVPCNVARSDTARHAARAFHGHAQPLAHTTPTKDDILVGTRLHQSLHLAGMNRFLDYHAGNARFRRDVDNVDLLPDLPQFWRDAAAAHVVERQLRRGGRFLCQGHEDGRFVEITREEGMLFARRALTAKSVLLMGEMDRTVPSMVSHLLFESVLRDTWLCRVSADDLELFRERMFEEEVEAGQQPPPRTRIRRTAKCALQM